MTHNLPVGQALLLCLRLVTASLLGGLLGFERQRSGKVAGLRTHMLVALGAATLFVVTDAVGGSTDDVARVVQGVAAGVGFIGGGAILKLGQGEGVRGITTAASIWMTAALGVAAGTGSLFVAIAAAVLAWVILGLLGRFESRPRGGSEPSE